MDKNLITYFKDGITINKLPTGKYSIFTEKTQRFTVDTLEELTPQSFIDAMAKLKEKEKLEEELMKEYRKEIKKQKKIEERSIDNVDFNYFKSIVELPTKTKISTKDGVIVDVGDEYLIKFNNDSELIVYIHSVYLKNKKKDDANEVGFIIKKSGALSLLSIGQIKKTIKEIKRIS